MVYSAVAGGTGSGVKSAIMGNSDLSYLPKVDVTVVPPPSFEGTPVIAPFEAVYGLGLDMYNRGSTEESCIWLDNVALGKYCSDQLGIAQPSMDDINRLIAH